MQKKNIFDETLAEIARINIAENQKAFSESDSAVFLKPVLSQKDLAYLARINRTFSEKAQMLKMKTG